MAKRLEDLAPQGLLERAHRAAALVDGVSRVRVLCHYDPDGTTSAAILARALMRRGKRVHATMSHALDAATVERVRAEPNELLLVSDMGSAQLDLLEALAEARHLGPLDHGPPLAVLAALAGSRLLIPVVAVLTASAADRAAQLRPGDPVRLARARTRRGSARATAW